MAYKINPDLCAGCKACLKVCPASAISEDGNKCVIDPNKCISCSACANVCPVQAIAPDVSQAA